LIIFFKESTKKFLLLLSILSFFQNSSVSTVNLNTPTKHLLSHLALLATTCILPAALNEWEKESLNLQTKSISDSNLHETQTFKEKMANRFALAQAVGKNLLRVESYDHLKKLRALFGPSKIDSETKSIEELEQFSVQNELTKYISQNRLTTALILFELANILRSGASVIQYALQPKIVDAHAGEIPPQPVVDPADAHAGEIPPQPVVDADIAAKASLVARLKDRPDKTTPDEEIDLMNLAELKTTLGQLNFAGLGDTDTNSAGNKNPLTLLPSNTPQPSPQPRPVTIPGIPSFEELQETRRRKTTLAAKVRNLLLKKKARAKLSELKEARKKQTSAAKIAATWRGFFSRKDPLEQKDIFNQAHNVSGIIEGDTQVRSAMITNPEPDDMPARAPSLESEADRLDRQIADAQIKEQTTRAHSNWAALVRKLGRAKSTEIIVHPEFPLNDSITRNTETPLVEAAAAATGNESEGDEEYDDDSFEAGSVSTDPDCEVGDQKSIDGEVSDHGYDTDDQATTAPQAVPAPHDTTDAATLAARMPTAKLEPKPESDAHALTQPPPAIKGPVQLTKAPLGSNKKRKKPLAAAAAAQAKEDHVQEETEKPPLYTDDEVIRINSYLHAGDAETYLKKNPQQLKTTTLKKGCIWITKLMNLSGSEELEIIEVTPKGFTLTEKNAREIINLYNKDIPTLSKIIGCDATDKAVNGSLAQMIQNQRESIIAKRLVKTGAQRRAEEEAAKPWWKPRFSW
jgi:hypothetical protein